MTAVLMCAGDGRRLDRVVAGATSVPDLCRDPAALGAVANGHRRVVVILHRDAYDLSAVQTAARSCGIDPLGVQIVHHEDSGDDRWMATRVEGAIARADAVVESRPEHAKPVFPSTLSRRALLRPPRPEYVAVPFLDAEVCVSQDGCTHCVSTCPVQAYSSVAGLVSFDKGPCISCGRCITACPVGAISSPAVSSTQLRAQIERIVATAEGPAGIAFTCAHVGAPPPPPAWYPVQVPCTAMVPPTWFLGALLLGADSVTATACGDEVTALRFAADILAAAGLPKTAVVESPAGPADTTSLAMPVVDPFGLRGPTEVALALADMAPGGDFATDEHPASPLGVVAIDASTCTLCGQCAQICPTDALMFAGGAEEVALSFDPTCCTACDQCFRTCPERHRGAIEVRHAVVSEQLQAGRQVLNSGTSAICEACGRPIAPIGMMARIGELLGDDHPGVTEYLSRRCMDCRGM